MSACEGFVGVGEVARDTGMCFCSWSLPPGAAHMDLNVVYGSAKQKKPAVNMERNLWEICYLCHLQHECSLQEILVT